MTTLEQYPNAIKALPEILDLLECVASEHDPIHNLDRSAALTMLYACRAVAQDAIKLAKGTP
jgi:hypothetical protein